MESEIPESNPTPAVPGEIPSAVRSGATWNTPMLLALAVVGILIVFLLKGGNRKPVAPEAELGSANSTDINNSIPPTSVAAPVAEQPASERSEAESLRDIRRKSPIVIYNNNTGSANTPASPTTPAAGDPSPDVPLPVGFHPSAAANAHSTALGDREFIIAQGKLIDAVLETAIDTDHPGLLRALVSNDIYGDSGQTILLPRGSRLIGQYDSDVAQGQNRVFVIWQRVIRPDGVDIALQSGGTDPLGQAGLEGKVNHHFLTMFGAATLLSVIGASASTIGVGAQDNNNSLSTYRSSISQGFNEASNNVLGVFVRIKPTVKVHQGMPIKVFVARDLYFDPATFSQNRIQVIQ